MAEKELLIGFRLENILIAENKMNFLTLPASPGAIAIWSGGGFQVNCLKDASWLKQTTIYYWGDLDEHGFQILHQIRSYYPQTKSVMMDLNTLEQFTLFRVKGASNKAERLSLLTAEERQTYDVLKASELNRLEQEKIDQRYVELRIKELFEK